MSSTKWALIADTNFQPALPIVEDEKPSKMWSQMRRIMSLLRIVAPIVYLLLAPKYDLFRSHQHIWNVVFCIAAVYWNLLALVLPSQKFALLTLELMIGVEAFFALGALYVLITSVGASLGPEDLGDVGQEHRNSIRRFHIILGLCLPILIPSILLLDQYIRSYSANWRYRQDYRRIKPVLVFNETGDPVAILPVPAIRDGVPVERLSTDSLQGLVNE
ncbi:hypothetical protein GGS20DRAFT_302111 [Poronia punctata]|nr:hypothetical protein GGS20DRAFT_302111 [Poronia punctata]